MKDVFGKALLDYQNGRYSEDIITYSSLDDKDLLPLPYLFRDFAHMPPLEQCALNLCKGTVLDIGCGAGSHSLYLQQQGFAVTALDASPGAVETCRLRGIHDVVHADIYDFTKSRFDTLLLLMNGIGLAGHFGYLNDFLGQLKSILQPDGQILVDSSDIAYMYEDPTEEMQHTQNQLIDYENYYGEVGFVMEYKGEKGNPFSWLYLDFKTLERVANTNDMHCELVLKGHHYDYLVRLTPQIYR